MLPHLGAGVGQGFEDVLVLCRLLSDPETNASNIAVACILYIHRSFVLTDRNITECPAGI